MKDILIVICMIGGLFFFTVGTIGILRFPDIFSRAHSAAKCDTLGAILCLTALSLYSGFSFSTLKIILAISFLWLTAPTATHLITKAAHTQITREKTNKLEKHGVNRDENI